MFHYKINPKIGTPIEKNQYWEIHIFQPAKNLTCLCKGYYHYLKAQRKTDDYQVMSED